MPCSPAELLCFSIQSKYTVRESMVQETLKSPGLVRYGTVSSRLVPIILIIKAGNWKNDFTIRDKSLVSFDPIGPYNAFLCSHH